MGSSDTNVRCKNCHSNFQPAQDTGLVQCPHCDTSITLSPSSDLPSSLLDANCSSCGQSMASGPSQNLPLCQDCRGESAVDAPDQWMIRKVEGKIYGPFSRAVLEEWILAGKIQSDDSVAQAGRQWQAFYEHPSFIEKFSARSRKKGVGRAEKRALGPPKPGWLSQLDPRVVLHFGAAALFLVGSLYGAWYSTTNLALVVPDSVTERIKTTVSEWVASQKSKNKVPRNLVAEEAHAVVMDLAKTHRDIEGSPTALRLQGVSLFHRYTEASRLKARTLLEQAVVLGPDDPRSLSALVEIWSYYLREEEESNLLKPALRLADRAYQLMPSSPEVLRARARYLAASGLTVEAVGVARQAYSIAPDDVLSMATLGATYIQSNPAKNGKAAEILGQAITVNKRLPAVHFDLGQAQEALGHYGPAVESYLRVLTLVPSHEVSLQTVGEILERIGKPIAALEYYQKAIRASKGTALLSVIRAGVLELQAVGNATRGKQLLQTAKKSPSFERQKKSVRLMVLAQLATAHRISGQMRASLAVGDEALALEPNYSAAHFNKAMVYLRQGRYEDAFVALKLASDNEPDSKQASWLHYYQGMASISQQKPRVALAEFSAAVEFNPHNIEARLQLASLYLGQGQGGEAMTVMDGLASEDPQYKSRTYFHASPYVTTLFSKSGLAIPFIRQAKSRYYVADVLANLGIVYYHMGKKQKARQSFLGALKTDKRNARASFYLGVLQLESGYHLKGLRHFIQATESAPKVGMYWIYLGDTHRLLGQMKEAGRAFERAMQFEVQAPALKMGVGRMLYQQGEKEAAHEALMAALKVDPDFSAASRLLYKYGL